MNTNGTILTWLWGLLYVRHQKHIHAVENYTVNNYKLPNPKVWDGMDASYITLRKKPSLERTQTAWYLVYNIQRQDLNSSSKQYLERYSKNKHNNSIQCS